MDEMEMHDVDIFFVWLTEDFLDYLNGDEYGMGVLQS